MTRHRPFRKVIGLVVAFAASLIGCAREDTATLEIGQASVMASAELETADLVESFEVAGYSDSCMPSYASLHYIYQAKPGVEPSEVVDEVLELARKDGWTMERVEELGFIAESRDIGARRPFDLSCGASPDGQITIRLEQH